MSNLFSPLTDSDIKRIAIVLLLVIANFVFAVLGALIRGGFDPARGGFDFRKLPEFVYKDVLPYVVGLAFFEAMLHILPPSVMVGNLFGGQPSPTGPAPIIPVEPGAGWQWLDPTVLWATYAAVVLSLVQKTLANLTYLFGKGINLAQELTARFDKDAAVPPATS